ncbi:DUF4837 family protein [bacterium]|nr:DUF4837 family protein [bacterium]
MKRLILSICVVAIIASTGCDTPRDAVGSFSKIPVLIDVEELGRVGPALSNAVEVEIRTPRKEKIFKLEYIDSTKMARLINARTSIIAASLKSPGPAGDFVRNALSDDAKKMVASGEYWLIAKKDLWARDQLTIIITAPTAEDLESRLDLGGSDIFKIINDSVNERVSQWLFGKAFAEGEKTELEDSIAAGYGFGIRVPRLWEWEKGAPKERFIWLRALEPERWVFVWWAPLDSSMDFSVERWCHVRDSLCAIYYEGDRVSTKMPPETTGTSIGGRPAVQIRALWENKKTALGGPIVSFVLSDPITNRLYIVDGAVFAPAVRKEPYLRHVEIVCRSFRSDLPAFYKK